MNKEKDKNNWDKYKIDLTGFEEMDNQWYCQNCETELTWNEHVIGWGYYPEGGYRNMMKKNKIYGFGYECPKCFLKQCCHVLEDCIETFVDGKELRERT